MSLICGNCNYGEEIVNIGIVVPALNGGDSLAVLLCALNRQLCRPDQILVVDSESTDNTMGVAKLHGTKIFSISRKDFNHGATRQMAVEALEEIDVFVFFTQDVLVESELLLGNIVNCFKDSSVGMAYGRQMPQKKASPTEAFARLYNYPEQGTVKSAADIPKMGIKAAFASNSFAAYRQSALMEVGGFPGSVILGEDMYVAAKMILAGWKVAYCAEAAVYHSHDYSIKQEFKRYFDIGVFHAREAWIGKSFGKAEGEGKRFVLSEWKYLWKNGYAYLIPSAIVRTIMKYFGYRLGKIEEILPLSWKKKISMHKGYWEKGKK